MLVTRKMNVECVLDQWQLGPLPPPVGLDSDKIIVGSVVHSAELNWKWNFFFLRKAFCGLEYAPDPTGGARDAPPDPLVGWGGDIPPQTPSHSAPPSASRPLRLRRSGLPPVHIISGYATVLDMLFCSRSACKWSLIVCSRMLNHVIITTHCAVW